MIRLTSLESPILDVCVLRGEITTFRLEGELDFGSAHVLEAAACLLPEDTAAVVVDLESLSFVDVAGADTLAALHAAQVIRGRMVRLTNARPHVRRILGILRMESLLSPTRLPGHRTSGSDLPAPDWLKTTPLPLNPRTRPTPRRP